MIRAFARAAFSTAVVRTALLSALSLQLVSGCQDDDSAEHAALHGTVRDAMSGDRLKNVKVEFVSDTLERASDTTDSQGKFAIDVATMSVSGRLIASKSGYQMRTVSVFLDDADVTVDIDLEHD